MKKITKYVSVDALGEDVCCIKFTWCVMYINHSWLYHVLNVEVFKLNLSGLIDVPNEVALKFDTYVDRLL